MASSRAAAEQVAVIQELAREKDVKVGMVEVASEHLKRVNEVMGEKGDIAAIYGATREEAGLSFER